MNKLWSLIIFIFGVVLLTGEANAQQYPWVRAFPNDPTTATVQFKAACENASGFATVCTTSPSAYLGICVQNCGTTGSALIAYAGLVPVIVDATSTLKHYVVVSTSAGGSGTDTAATTYPTSGILIGKVQTASTGAASTSYVDITPEIQPVAGGSVTTNQNYREISFFFDGGGSAITSAITRCGQVDFAGTINKFTLLADVSGTAKVTIYTLGTGSYTGVASVTTDISNGGEQLTAAASLVDSTLTSWTTTVTANSTFCFALTTPSTATWYTGTLRVSAN